MPALPGVTGGHPHPEAEALLALQRGDNVLAAAWTRRLTQPQIERMQAAAKRLFILGEVHIAAEDFADGDG